jgi:hypothetical protein
MAEALHREDARTGAGQPDLQMRVKEQDARILELEAQRAADYVAQ